MADDSTLKTRAETDDGFADATRNTEVREWIDRLRVRHHPAGSGQVWVSFHRSLGVDDDTGLGRARMALSPSEARRFAALVLAVADEAEASRPG